MQRQRAAKGFTLIELITVIVVLGILSVIGSQFIVSSTESYATTQARARLQATGRQALERMSRELRGALPYSVRKRNGGSCLEFVPITYSGFYIEPVPVASDTGKDGKVNVADISAASNWSTNDALDKGWVVVAPLGADEIYGNSAGARAKIKKMENDVITYEPHQWLRNSGAKRYFLVSKPSAFCVSADKLIYLKNIDWGASSLSLSEAYSVVASIDGDGLDGVGVFDLGLETYTNRSLVTFSIPFSSGGESIIMTQQVAVRNVP